MINAGISAGRGNWGTAAFSLACAIPIVGDAAGAGKIAKKTFDANQSALIQLAKEAKKAHIDIDDANTLLKWADEYKLPHRGPEIHPNRPHGQNPHIHVGPVDHIFIR